MEAIRLPFKDDDYGNPNFARIAWSSKSHVTHGPKPIAIVYHGGGLLVGSSEIIPKTQINYLATVGFVVVMPNYRLAPQVTAKEAFADGEEAYEWATTVLPGIMQAEHGLELDSAKVVVMGHSTGGTLALHMASCKPVKAVTAFYPSLFNSDMSTSAHKPTSAPPFGMMPDFHPTDGDWAEITPDGKQISEEGLAAPGTVPSPRSKWQMHILKHGHWMTHLLPDGDFAAIDPMTRLRSDWPPTMIVQGELDNVPGSSLELAQRAERELKAADVKKVQLEVIQGASHMFDLPPTIGTNDLGPKWQAVLKGLDWLTVHVHM